jgi:hypothetical protein
MFWALMTCHIMSLLWCLRTKNLLHLQGQWIWFRLMLQTIHVKCSNKSLYSMVQKTHKTTIWAAPAKHAWKCFISQQVVRTHLYEMPVPIIQLPTPNRVPLLCPIELYLHQQFPIIQLSKYKGLLPRTDDWRWTQVKYRTILLTSSNEHGNIHNVTYWSPGSVVHHHSYKAVCNILMTKRSCCQIWNSSTFTVYVTDYQ